ncbi:MAG: aminotransferase class IV [Actinobacteria bacterium]|nr:aminotransferase class IV [Actinomycetota bacterium]
MEVYVNGEFMDECKASVSALDRGLLLGEGLFETMRAYSGVIFMLDRHLERIVAGMKTLGFKNIPARDVLSRACRSILATNGIDDARVRLTITRGTVTAKEPTVVVTADRYHGYEPELYAGGMSAITLRGYRISGSPVHQLKSTSYLPSLIAGEQALAEGCHEAILVNEKGDVAEGSFTNVFMIEAGTLFTPPIEDGLLPGITRGCVLEIAASAGIEVLQERVSVSRLRSAQEVFLTNSLLEIMPLTRVDQTDIGDGKPGKLTLELREGYRGAI